MPQLSRKDLLDQQSRDLGNMVDNCSQDELPAANIIVAGITGAGKSTLINAVFGQELARTGVGRPITDEIQKYNDPKVPICVWDTVGLELDSARAEKSIKDIRDTIAKQTSVSNQFDRIHAIWYCVCSGSNRYQGVELQFIKDLHKIGVPFIIVQTQCVRGQADDEFEAEIRRINKDNGIGDIEVIQVIAKDVESRLGNIPSFGLEKLVTTTTQRLPEFIKSGFIAAQRIDVVQKRKECEKIIMDYVQLAKGGFWDKVPLVNVFTTDKKIMQMLKKIGVMYNANLPQESIEKVLKNSNVNFSNNFSGLINPFYFKYRNKVSAFLEEMQKKEGLEVHERTFKMSERAARMIAFYGYTFVMSIEDVWNELSEETLKNANVVSSALIDRINKYLDEVRRGQNGNEREEQQ